ncbi:hypothetical protein PS2_028231 [Malus domestica]
MYSKTATLLPATTTSNPSPETPCSPKRASILPRGSPSVSNPHPDLRLPPPLGPLAPLSTVSSINIPAGNESPPVPASTQY